ncbi:APC family permease [Alicyclobacillus ferrooxydans]|uniref:APC family permease n=1 Tax=Alicyclobacillus ferrooxydans TaxID=471514 RepID=UPI0006D54779|nr:APC family permease [Alicyclobacillus ferrooxydans]
MISLVSAVKRILIGRPLKTRETSHAKIGVLKGMAVMTPDALSSVAYATDQMESILVVVIGASASKAYISNVLGFSMIGTLIIIGLAFLLYLAYRNIIHSYPQGGGAYAIGLNDLGKFWGLSAASTLIVGYTLTVAVSVAAGIDAIGPVVPFIGSHKMLANVILTLIIMLINLRGTSESANVFVPFTYVFIGCILLLGVGAGIEAMTHPQSIHMPTSVGMHAVQGMGLFLFLRMFANGCSALTGVEAVSNSVPVFKDPSSKRAQRLLLTLVVTLSLLFLIVSSVAMLHGLTYNPDIPLINQESMLVFGTHGFGYVVTVIISFATMCILGIAANTAFTGCPALWSSMARDGYMPRWVLHKGDRLVYSNGIVFLTLISLVLTIGFDAKVNELMPLYGVSVFYTFSVSQLGMVVRTLREKDTRWVSRAAMSIIGFTLTAAACLIFGITRFTNGAWLVFVCVPLMVFAFSKIRVHYEHVKDDLKYDFTRPLHVAEHSVTIVPIASVNKSSVNALEYAIANFKNVIAVTVIAQDSVDVAEAKERKFRAEWERLHSGVRLIVIHSQYRAVAKRIQRFIELELDLYDNENITVVVPQFITKRWWHKLLHNKTGSILMAWLLLSGSVKVIAVPYRLPR